MEQAQGSQATGGQPVSPVKAVVALFAVLGAALLAWWLSRPDEAPSTSPSTTSNQATATLTEAEALQEFERLDALRIQAFENVDASLVSHIAYPGSPFERTVLKELRALARSDVSPRLRFTTKSLEVEDLSSNEAVVLQEVVQRYRFFDATGKDVTVDYAPLRRSIQWMLRHDGTEWLIYDSVILSSKEVKR
jgi:hypothetical protein